MLTDKNRVAAFFNGLAQDYYQKRYACLQDINSFGMLNRLQKVTLLLDRYAPGPGRLVDLGCGPANIFEIIQKRGYEYYGIDISTNMIRQARRRTSQQAPCNPAMLVTGDVCHTGFPDHFFDVGLALGLMDYLQDERTFYQEFFRLLKPGGVGLITYGNKYSYYTAVRHLLEPLSRILRAKDRVLGALKTRAFASRHEQRKLVEQGFDILELVFLGAHIIPFNLPMPQVYFSLLAALERLWQQTHFYIGLSSFILVVKKPG